MKTPHSRFATFFLLLCLLLAWTGGVNASPVSPYSFRTEWAKLSAVDGKALAHGIDKNVFMTVLWLLPEDGYHTYSHTPGADGTPLTIQAYADGAPMPQAKVQVRYAPGTEKTDETGAKSYILSGEVPVFIIFKEYEDKAVTLDISLLACSDRHCLPVHTQLLLPTVPPDLNNAAERPWFSALTGSIAGNAADDASGARADVSSADEARLLELLPEANTSVFKKQDEAGASVDVPSARRQTMEHTGYAFQPQSLEGSFQINSLLRAIGIGILAGLLLNFMPCVLPVLTMKFSVLLESGTYEERKRSIRMHNIFFAAGIIVWFALLAVITGLTGILWGQLFQSSEVIFFMLLIVFCMGLSMFDLFHLPVLDLQAQHSRSPKMQAFSTGMFTTLLATPCSGPLLGGVLAWGITKPLPVLMTIFAATGVGMALPYVVLACFPRLIRLMPKPGQWFSVLERILGLMLMGTAIYLFSLLPPALHVKTLITLLVAATSAWVWGRWGSLRGSITRRMFLGAFSVGAIFLCAFWAFLPAQKEAVSWIAFTEDSFRKNLGQKPMIVEFTADWCPTCKVLERTTLAAPNLLPILDQYSLTAVKVDMTFKNEAQQDLLKALQSASIPLLAVFPAGEKAASPVILRDIYSVTDLHLALRQAKIPHKRMVEMLNPVKLLTQPKE
ncbi:MAG: thioredoxin family protein [Mailhella sp.]|nr:thioredoxin family protein [Mailhella sp.]